MLPAAALLVEPSAGTGWLDPWRQAGLLARSLAVALGAAVTASVLGTAAAVVLAHRDLPGRILWWLAALVPLLVPPYLWTVAWMRLGLPTGHAWAVSLGLGACLYPLVAFPGLLALERCSASLVDQARLSRGPREVWTTLLLPLAAPFLAGGALLVFLVALAEYGVPSLLQVDTFAVEILTLVNGYHDFPAAARASLALLLPGLGVVLLAARILGRRARTLQLPQGAAPAVLRLGPSARWGGLALAAGGAGILVGLPLGVLARQADRFPLALWQAGPDLLYSLGACAAAAVIAAALGAWLAASRSRGLGVAAAMLLAVPPALLALGWVRWWGGGPSLLEAGLAARYLPVPVLLLLASYLAAAPGLDEAARLRPGSARLRFIDLHRPTLRLAVGLVFALALGDLTLGLLLTPAGGGTLAVRIFNLNHYGQPDLVAALCLVQAAACLSPMLAAAAWNALEERR